jgi:hypothetical protein
MHLFVGGAVCVEETGYARDVALKFQRGRRRGDVENDCASGFRVKSANTQLLFAHSLALTFYVHLGSQITPNLRPPSKYKVVQGITLPRLTGTRVQQAFRGAAWRCHKAACNASPRPRRRPMIDMMDAWTDSSTLRNLLNFSLFVSASLAIIATS